MSLIVTLTLNPALDISSSVESVVVNHKLRCDSPMYEPGGGGINVARVAQRLGCQVKAVVPLGGSAGQRVASLLEAERIPVISVAIGSETRESITIGMRGTEDQYRFVFPGPEVTAGELQDCERSVVAEATTASCVVLSGSLPSTVPAEIFSSMVRALAPVPVIIDTSGDALVAALNSGAFLVKPSARELATIAGRKLLTEADIVEASKSVLADSNVATLAVSIGAGGVILVGQDGLFVRLRAPAVQVASTVGAGDSMVAGIAVGLDRGLSLVEATKLGVAAGTATVMTMGTQLCDPTQVESLLELVVVD